LIVFPFLWILSTGVRDGAGFTQFFAFFLAFVSHHELMEVSFSFISLSGLLSHDLSPFPLAWPV
jgi:hypothetical protein